MAACGDENGIPPRPFSIEIAAIISQKSVLEANWGVKMKPAVYISHLDSRGTPGVDYFINVSITTPVVSALKNYYE